MLESLEREYRREEDWCSTEKANNSDKVTYMSQLLTKHQEQKEAFLKVSAMSLTKHQEWKEAFLKVSTISRTKHQEQEEVFLRWVPYYDSSHQTAGTEGNVP